ncbi:hypothetical protein Leryth_026868 [Lithospermum erythrorhizon]|nr:hypothetical protein Leryth_026868 [Lithospermum erythrorhizon]
MLACVIYVFRNSFPPDFIFATASSAFQYEGAANIDGRGPSIWDHIAHNYPEKILDGSNGDVTQDFYHRYKVQWVVPTGKVSRGVNKKGIEFYNRVINELISNGIKPFVTIYHWDIPQPLQDEYGGFVSPRIVNDYLDFADICFKQFGDRVKHWMTHNEPPFI